MHPRPVANFATSFAGVVDTGGKFATAVNDAGDKLPPVSRQWRQICHRCQQHQWQTMGTISDHGQLKVNWKEKIYLYAKSATQRWPKDIMKTFLIEDFFHLP